jgi:hypothetical protein
MPQICHRHCPSDGPSLLGFVIGAGAVVVFGGMAIMAVIDQMVIIGAISVVVLAATGIWYLLHVLRRDAEHVTSRETADRLAERLRRPVAAPARKALPVTRQAITGAYVITDVKVTPEPARIAIRRDGTVTR